MSFSLILVGQPLKMFLWSFGLLQTPRALRFVTLTVPSVQRSSCEGNHPPWMWWGEDGGFICCGSQMRARSSVPSSGVRLPRRRVAHWEYPGKKAPEMIQRLEMLSTGNVAYSDKVGKLTLFIECYLF